MLQWGWYKRAYIAALRQAKFYPGWQAAAATAGSTSSIAAAAVHKQQYTSWIIPRVLRLVYCGSYKFEGSLAPVHEPHFARVKEYLVYCGSAAVGIDGPQYKPFSTPPCSRGWKVIQSLLKRNRCNVEFIDCTVER